MELIPGAKSQPDTTLCPNCHKPNPRGEPVCYACGRILDLAPAGAHTRTLSKADSMSGFTPYYFDQDSRLFLQVRGTNRAFELRPQDSARPLVVGRDSSDLRLRVDVDLSANGGDRMGVSRQHLAIRYDAQARVVTVTDLGSANGSHINGQRLHPGEVRALNHGDQLRLGKLVLLVTILYDFDEIDLSRGAAAQG
jgi:pSer/pThr/pTyr-binding forkhead associated (FHA) protein